MVEVGVLMEDVDLTGGYLCATNYDLFDATSTLFLSLDILLAREHSWLDERFEFSVDMMDGRPFTALLTSTIPRFRSQELLFYGGWLKASRI